jgi:hypothetical protein
MIPVAACVRNGAAVHHHRDQHHRGEFASALGNLGSRERLLVGRQQAHLHGVLLRHFAAHRALKVLTRREQLGDRGRRGTWAVLVARMGRNKLQGRQPSLRLKFQQRHNRFSWRDPRIAPAITTAGNQFPLM